MTKTKYGIIVAIAVLAIGIPVASALPAGTPWDEFCEKKTTNKKATAADFICENDFIQMVDALSDHEDRIALLEMGSTSVDLANTPDYSDAKWIPQSIPYGQCLNDIDQDNPFGINFITTEFDGDELVAEFGLNLAYQPSDLSHILEIRDIEGITGKDSWVIAEHREDIRYALTADVVDAETLDLNIQIEFDNFVFECDSFNEDIRVVRSDL